MQVSEYARRLGEGDGTEMGASVLTVNVYCEWDEEARVWYVAHSDVPGLTAEAATPEAMNRLLEVRVPELMELNRPDICGEHAKSAHLDLVIQAKQRLRLECA